MKALTVGSAAAEKLAELTEHQQDLLVEKRLRHDEVVTEEARQLANLERYQEAARETLHRLWVACGHRGASYKRPFRRWKRRSLFGPGHVFQKKQIAGDWEKVCAHCEMPTQTESYHSNGSILREKRVDLLAQTLIKADIEAALIDPSDLPKGWRP